MAELVTMNCWLEFDYIGGNNNPTTTTTRGVSGAAPQEHSLSKAKAKHDRAWSPNGRVTVMCQLGSAPARPEISRALALESQSYARSSVVTKWTGDRDVPAS